MITAIVAWTIQYDNTIMCRLRVIVWNSAAYKQKPDTRTESKSPLSLILGIEVDLAHDPRANALAAVNLFWQTLMLLSTDAKHGMLAKRLKDGPSSSSDGVLWPL